MKHLCAAWPDHEVGDRLRALLVDVIGQRVNYLDGHLRADQMATLADCGVETLAGRPLAEYDTLTLAYAAEVAYILTALDVVRDGSAPATEGLGVRLTGCGP